MYDVYAGVAIVGARGQSRSRIEQYDGGLSSFHFCTVASSVAWTTIYALRKGKRLLIRFWGHSAHCEVNKWRHTRRSGSKAVPTEKYHNEQRVPLWSASSGMKATLVRTRFMLHC